MQKKNALFLSMLHFLKNDATPWSSWFYYAVAFKNFTPEYIKKKFFFLLILRQPFSSVHQSKTEAWFRGCFQYISISLSELCCPRNDKFKRVVKECCQYSCWKGFAPLLRALGVVKKEEREANSQLQNTDTNRFSESRTKKTSY